MCVESLECVSTNFAKSFSDLENLRPPFPFWVKPFVVDVVKDGCSVQKPIITQTANIEPGSAAGCCSQVSASATVNSAVQETGFC